MFKKILHGLTVLGLLLPIGAYAQSCSTTQLAHNGSAVKICDLTFTNVPTFTGMCALSFQTGTYTIQNNTPVAMMLNYIRIKANDARPASDVALDTSVANSCISGSSLAAGATCNIKLNLQPQSAGSLNRILQIGIDSRQVELDSTAITSNVTTCSPANFPPGIVPATKVSFSQFSIFGSSTITNTGNSIITGDIGLTPGTAITGFPPGIITGSIHVNDADTAAARIAILAVYDSLWAQTCPATDLPVTIAANTTLTPGVHCGASSVTVNNNLTLTLDGQGDPLSTFTLQIPISLTLNNNVTINLINGAAKENIYWVVGVTASLGTADTFFGNIITGPATDTAPSPAGPGGSISLTNGTSVGGRLQSLNGAVTLINNAVNPN
jgi:hypothetical protein